MAIFSTSSISRNSHAEVLLRKGVLIICSKCTGEHPCQSAISTNLQSNFIETALWHVYSPVNLLHILRTPFPKSTSGRLLLYSIGYDSTGSLGHHNNGTQLTRLPTSVHVAAGCTCYLRFYFSYGKLIKY